MRTRFMSMLAVVLITLAPFGGPSSAQPGPAQMDRTARALVDSGFSGVVLVASGDTIVLRRAYGGANQRLAPTSVFWIASITKSFTAAAIVSLAQEKRLSLSDSLSRFFPSAPPDKRAITIQQLLTHTAGLPATNPASGQTTRDGAARAIFAESLSYPPGRGYLYGNNDYALLAAIVEIVTRQPWHSYVCDSVLEPRGLTRFGFMCDAESRVPIAAADGRRTSCSRAGRADWAHIGSNGMSGTADDLLKWASVLGSDAGRSSFPGLASPQIIVRREGPYEVAYGYGVRVYTLNGKVAEVMHSGSGDDGHSAIVRQLASGLTIVVLSNAGQHGSSTWSSYVAERLAPRLP